MTYTRNRALVGATVAMFASSAMASLMLRGAGVAYEPNDDRGQKSASELATEIKRDFEKKFDEVKEKAEKAVTEAQKGIDQTNAQKEIIDGALVGMNEAKARLDELEQKMARKGGPGEDEERKSLGQRFVEDEKVKAFLDQAQPRGRVDISAKATITSSIADAAGAVGNAVNQTRIPGIMPLPQRRMIVRDLLTPGNMGGNTLEYVKETGFTNNAGMVAEGAAKPSSDIKAALVSTTAKVIAHYMKASRQILDDVPQLQSTIDQRLLYGLAYKEESQILNGDGTGQNLLGIIPQATAYAAPIALPGATRIDMIRLAMLQAILAEYPASGHVMNPIDWAFIETLKDGQGRYIIGNPQGQITPTLWGLPVVQTQAISVDKFLTGAFQLGAQIFDRWAARVEIATENEDDFIKNLLTVLGEERVALAVYRPEAFIYGDFGGV